MITTKHLFPFNNNEDYENAKNAGLINKPSVSFIKDSKKCKYSSKKQLDNLIDINNYLTIYALEDGLTAKLSINDCEYCINGDGNWKQLIADTYTNSINTGQTLSFRGLLVPTSSSGIGTFTVNKKYKLKGNIMSLLFGDNTSEITDLTGYNYAFYKLFNNNTTLIDASELSLPATTLTLNCYGYMFQNCTSLTATPSILPATTPASSCYSYMFSGCTGLTTAPSVLPATTLASSCYSYMFNNCKKLTTAPDLPATTLTKNCYYTMFGNCSNLNYIKMLATDISAADCLKNWVSGVSSTGTFVKHFLTEIPTATSSNNYAGIPSGWTVINDGEENNDPTSNGHEYVDLGLPSGTLWAKFNVGAERESDYGLYFAWGEVEGYPNASSGKIFSWDDYIFEDGDSCDGKFTKYDSSDHLTTLLSEDDAASVNMGGSWHIPSKEQCEELINSSYTDTSWTTVNGVYGRKITSKTNNNTLFLPASGYCNWGSVIDIHLGGYYWGSSLDRNYPFYGLYLYYNSSYDITAYSTSHRQKGQSVRGVIG